jgi:hypothetical protein
MVANGLPVWIVMPVVFALIFMSLATAAYCAYEIVADTSLDRGHVALVPGSRTSPGPDAGNLRALTMPAPSTDGRGVPSRTTDAAVGSRKTQAEPKARVRAGNREPQRKAMPRGGTPAGQQPKAVAQDVR